MNSGKPDAAQAQRLVQCIKDHLTHAGVKESVLNGDRASDSVTRAMNRLATQANQPTIASVRKLTTAIWGWYEPEHLSRDRKSAASANLFLSGLTADLRTWSADLPPKLDNAAALGSAFLALVFPEPDAGSGNPFAWCGAIRDPAHFFGRENVLRHLRDALKNGQNTQLNGPRRIGKSSLLLATHQRLKSWGFDHAKLAWVDMQDVANHTQAGFLRTAARAWGWPAPAPEEPPLALAAFSDRVKDAVETRKPPTLILAMDECEQFIQLTAEFPLAFFETLRALSQKGLSILTASKIPLREIRRRGALLSPAFNSYPPEPIGCFTPEERDTFIQLKRPDFKPFTNVERDALLEVAKDGHPLKLQRACYRIADARASHASLFQAVIEAKADLAEMLDDGP